MSSSLKPKLLASKGTGSQLAELAFAAAKLPLDVRYIEWEQSGLEDAELTKHNPLKQVPTMIMPDGSVLTQSGAIILRVNDLVPEAGLVPSRDVELRTRFFHWFMFINVAIYPTFTYGDIPDRWLPGQGGEAEAALKKATDDHRCEQWLRVEKEAKGPWFLGETFSALDLYIAVMNPWRPRSEWFASNAPKLTAIRRKVSEDPRFKEVIAKNS